MPLYSVGTWDADLQTYTPQIGLSVPSVNVPLWTLLQIIRELRKMGYECHRLRSSDGNHFINDSSVLIERTDGNPFQAHSS